MFLSISEHFKCQWTITYLAIYLLIDLLLLKLKGTLKMMMSLMWLIISSLRYVCLLYSIEGNRRGILDYSLICVFLQCQRHTRHARIIKKRHVYGLGQLRRHWPYPNFLPPETGESTVITVRISSLVWYMPITFLKMHTYEEHLLTTHLRDSLVYVLVRLFKIISPASKFYRASVLSE